MIADPAPQLTVPVSERDHVQGSLDAPVILVEYGDYECPHCGAAYLVVKELQRQFSDDLAFGFRNFPLATVHPHAVRAAEAAEAAAVQDRFWPMHGRLFEHQDALDDQSLVEHAASLGLDLGQFVDDLVQRRHLDRIRDDLASGARSGVNGTPTFFINGFRHNGGYDLRTLAAALTAGLPVGRA
jgi:protein-disulfide isomerase